MQTYLFESNGRQEVDDDHWDKTSDETKNPADITLDICDIKPVSLSNIHQNKSTKTFPIGIIRYGRKVQLCQIRIFSLWKDS